MICSPMGGLSIGEVEFGPRWKGRGVGWEPPFRLHSAHDGALWICGPPCGPREVRLVSFEPSRALLSTDTHLEWVGWGQVGGKSKNSKTYCQKIHIFSTCYSICGWTVDRMKRARWVVCSPIIGLSNNVV